ncbi:MAG: hypothetical protein JXR86_20355 [Spirochaetales bacterium]|nr:hypothetical protein [Spirochaetales bacterium]
MAEILEDFADRFSQDLAFIQGKLIFSASVPPGNATGAVQADKYRGERIDNIVYIIFFTVQFIDLFLKFRVIALS